MENQKPSQYEIMTQTPIPSLVVRLSIPTIISMMITNVYNLADTAFVGQLGNSASGAVGVVFGFMSIIQAVGFMFGQGSGSIISRALGKKDTEQASVTASTGLFFALIFGLLITVCGSLTLDPLVRLLGSTETIAPYAKTYITYILAAAPIMTASFVMNNILRYEGKASLGMIGLLIGAVLNICCDPLLMFVLDMGIAGAGLSTAISQTVSFCILLSMFLRGKTQSRLSFRSIFFPSVMILNETLNKSFLPSAKRSLRIIQCFLNIIATGFPSLLRQGLTSVATVLLNSESAVYGDEAVAAMSIVSRIAFFVTSVALGIGQGFQPISGFNYGAGKYNRLRQAFRFTLILSEVLITVAVAVVMIFSGELIGVFRSDDTVIEIGTRALRLQALSLLFLPLCMDTEMLFQSTGHRSGAAVLSSLRSGVFFIPALLILSRIRGLYGIEEAQPLSFVISFIPSLFFMLWFFRRLPREDTETIG